MNYIAVCWPSNLTISELPNVESDSTAAEHSRFEWSAQQKEILRLCEESYSLFFMGSAGLHELLLPVHTSSYVETGTGKSALLKEIPKRLRARGLNVDVTASTGQCNTLSTILTSMKAEKVLPLFQ